MLKAKDQIMDFDRDIREFGLVNILGSLTLAQFIDNAN